MRHFSAALALLSLSFLTWTEAGTARAEAGPSFQFRPDDHAPIGVMGDHIHKKGEWMLSYRFAYMRMKGNRDGTRRLSNQEVLQDFMVTPTDMDMYMHMFGAMYAPTDWVTVMITLPWIQKSMDHLTGMGQGFTTTTNEIGDFKTMGLFRLFENEHHEAHLNFGMSWPTGPILATDETPAGSVVLPFPMQTGSGTFDMIPGLTYNGKSDRLSWGAQVLGTYRIGQNTADYTASDRVDFSSWLAVPWTNWISTSGRVAVHWWSDYGGDQVRAPPPPTIPTARPDLRGGTSIDLLGGVNLYVPLGPLGRHRFAIEAGAPVEQWLDGPQLETDWKVIVGWQKAF